MKHRKPIRPGEHDLLTTSQVAKPLNVSRQTIARWVRNGHIKAVRLPSGMIRIHPSEVERILEGCKMAMKV